MNSDTAGDPMTGLKWTRRTTERIAQELQGAGIRVSAGTVARLLKSLGFSLRVNYKKISTTSNEYRDVQFDYIASLREKFARHGDPVISVDSKKKELIGPFKNPGTTWTREPIPVNDHDFRSEAEGMAIPYGVYDVRDNSAAVVVGTSRETSQFAACAIRKWWSFQGRRRYPQSKKLLVLADTGGGNGANRRAWKYFLQTAIADPFRVSVSVSHYPPGASKWNPIEHRLFSEISKNWKGRPLDSYDSCLNYICTTRTSTGLRVRAYLDTRDYEKGIQISDDEMAQLRLNRHEPLPQWNYTLRPRRCRAIPSQ